ncbi:MAG: hypothetical protein QOF01_1868, partial [Thermomicrobiales bacterium]|nr:hypothetical protein [Thermomicrobiales bacterium]
MSTASSSPRIGTLALIVTLMCAVAILGHGGGPTAAQDAPTDTPTSTPTDTPVPPTDTPIPTDTPVPPTETPIPPTDTPIPTDTPVPPTDTPVPPTETPIPPTDTPTTVPTDTATATTTPTGTATASPTAGACVPTTRSFVAAADAFVYQANPTTNSGAGHELRAKLSATVQYESYLRFDPTGISGGVASATLSLTSANYAGSETASAPEARIVTGTWAEGTITWATKPAYGAVIAAGGGAWPLNSPRTWDVTAAVAGNGSVSFALVPISADTVNANSREQTSGKPTLTVTFGCAAPPTPTPTPTTAPTDTPT